MAFTYGVKDISHCRPFGAYNLRLLATHLWNKLEVWIEESFGSNELLTMYQPLVFSRGWIDLKCDFQKWNTRMAIPNEMENDSKRIQSPDPKQIEEQFLYGMIKDKLGHIVEEFCMICKQLLNQNETDAFYNAYAFKAGLYFKAAVTLDSICAPLNSSWIAIQPVEHQVLRIRNLCHVIWREKIVRVIGYRLRSCLISLFEKERAGQVVDGEAMSNSLKSLVECKYQSFHEIKDTPDLAAFYNLNISADSKKLFLDTHVFKVLFGNEYLLQTERYIKEQARILATSNQTANIDVMRRINQIIRKEEGIAARGFHPYLLTRLEELLTQELILPNVRLFFPVFRDLLANKNEDEFGEFAPIFRLLTQAGGEHLHQLAVELESSFCTRGQIKISAMATGTNGQFVMPANPVKFGEGLIELYQQTRKFITLAMQDNPNFYDVLNRGLTRALEDNRISQQDPNKIQILLAHYLDIKMKTRMTVSELQYLILIVQLLTRRTQFLELFHLKLGKRLLLWPSHRVRIPFEKEMVKQFVSALNLVAEDYNTMFADKAHTNEVTNAFLRSPAAQARVIGDQSLFPLTRGKLEIRCLTTPAWRTSVIADKPSIKEWKLPIEASYIVTKFKETFEANNPARIITPVSTQNFAEMEWCVGHDGDYRTFSLNNCNFPMYIVLSYFGNTDSANYAQIQLASGLDNQNLTSVLEVLSKPIPKPRRPRGVPEANQSKTQANNNATNSPIRTEEIIIIRSEKIIGPTTIFTVNEQFNVPFPKIDLGNTNKIF